MNNPMVQLAAQFEDRDTKIAQYKLKKQLEANLDALKDYKDEAMQREFYTMQIKFSIMKTFEQLKMTEMELNVLAHKASLTPAQHAANAAKSAPKNREDLPPLQVTHIGPDDVKNMPYLLQPREGTQ